MTSIASAATSYHVIRENLELERLEFAGAIVAARERGVTWREIAEQAEMSIAQVRRIASLV